MFGGVAIADDIPPAVAVAKQEAAAALNRLAAVSQQAGITTAPIVVQAQSQSTWEDIRDWIGKVAFPAAISGLLYLMSIHTKIMQQESMNSQITTSAYGYGALLAQHVLANGGSAADLGVKDPRVAQYVDLLFKNYPDYMKKLGFNQEKAAGVIVKGAALATVSQASSSLPPPPVEKKPEQILFESMGGTNWEAQSDAVKNTFLDRYRLEQSQRQEQAISTSISGQPSKAPPPIEIPTPPRFADVAPSPQPPLPQSPPGIV
jgi:hypothetical protein